MIDASSPKLKLASKIVHIYSYFVDLFSYFFMWRFKTLNVFHHSLINLMNQKTKFATYVTKLICFKKSDEIYLV